MNILARELGPPFCFWSCFTLYSPSCLPAFNVYPWGLKKTHNILIFPLVYPVRSVQYARLCKNEGWLHVTRLLWPRAGIWYPRPAPIIVCLCPQKVVKTQRSSLTWRRRTCYSRQVNYFIAQIKCLYGQWEGFSLVEFLGADGFD